MASDSHRIVKIDIDPDSLAAGSADAEHERRIAIFDLLEENEFRLEGAEGPYHLVLSTRDGKLVIDIRDENDEPLHMLILSLAPFRRIIRDYFLICESYYDAIRHATPAQIEAVDMGRRGVHNEGSELLAERLKGKVACDFDTARRLFTLVCALHRPPVTR
jgi:uncharacterized protein (UPF0262 family)